MNQALTHSSVKRSTTPKAAIDWEGIRQHILTASAALNGLNENTPEFMEPVWAQRAARLAQVPTQTDDSEQLQLALLRLGREVFGIEVQYVFDIWPVEKITRVPRVPAWVTGVVNLRGRVFSIVDLKRWLNLENTAEPTPLNREDGTARALVVVTTPQLELALLADEVLPMETVSVNRLQEAGSTVRNIRPEFMRGLVDRASGDSMVVLDLAAVLADKQLILQEEVA